MGLTINTNEKSPQKLHFYGLFFRNKKKKRKDININEKNYFKINGNKYHFKSLWQHS